MYQKRIKRDFIHASMPKSDKPLKTKDVSELEKRRVEVCLNCKKSECKYGTCSELRGVK